MTDNNTVPHDLMTPKELLTEIHRRGAHLQITEHLQVVIDMPARPLPESLMSAISSREGELIEVQKSFDEQWKTSEFYEESRRDRARARLDDPDGCFF